MGSNPTPTAMESILCVDVTIRFCLISGVHFPTKFMDSFRSNRGTEVLQHERKERPVSKIIVSERVPQEVYDNVHRIHDMFMGVSGRLTTD